MTTSTPTRVVLYAFATGTPQPVAEFRWSPGSGITLTVIDPDWGSLAEEYYDQGVPSDSEQRLVPRTEAEPFMQALVEPRDTSYSRFIDESPRRERREQQ